MKLILTFCLVIFSVQYSEQVGYEGTHVYHDGDDVHEHHPLSPDVVQISRGHYKRPDRNRTEETSENPQTGNKHDKSENIQENSNNAEITNNSNVTLIPNIDENDTDSQNSSSKENNDGNKKEQLNKTETDKAPTSSEKEGDANKIEKPNENTSTRNNTINEVNKDIPKIVDNNGSLGTDISPELEHGQTQKIYETYPEAYEAITGKKFNQTESDDKPNKEINSLNIGHNEVGNNINNSEKKPNENNNNSVNANVESEGGKNKLYENYPDAFEGITGKTYNGSRENTSPIELEHGQTQKIYETYQEAYENITGKKLNKTQNGEKPNEEINSINISKNDEKTNNINNSEKKPNENNNNSVDANVESEGGKNKLYENYPDAFEGITGKTYNGTRENNSTIPLEHGQTQNIYETYPEAYEAITGKKLNKTQNGEKPNEEINSINISKNDEKTDNINNSEKKPNENNNNSVNANVESEGGKNTVYENYPDAFEGITGKTYNGSRENTSPIELEHGQTQKIYETYQEAYENITGKKYNGSQPAENNKPHTESTSTNANSANNTPSDASQKNQSIVSHENSSVTSGNEPPISVINGGNHESTEGVKQSIPHGGTSIIIQVGNNRNCNHTLINCNGQAQNIASSTTNVNNGTSSNKPLRGIQIIVNTNGKKCPPATSIKNVLLSQFKVKPSLQAV